MLDTTFSRFLKLFGRMMALVWAVFWIATGIWTGLSRAEGAVQTIEYALFPGCLFLVIVFLVWHWEKLGAWTLLLTGLLIITHVSRSAVAGSSWVLLAGPPLAGGILLLLYERLIEKPAMAE